MREGLWFLPTLLVLAGVGLAYLVLQLDLRYAAVLSHDHPNVFGVDPSGAYSIFSVIAQSMMTVAGVTFSITVVALSLAANQYSPRTLRNYMRDKGNQFVLGVFLGSFAFSVVMLRTIRGGDPPFVPSIGVIVAILLAILSIAVFIYFIHHVAASLVAAQIVETVAKDTVASLDKLFKAEDDGSLVRRRYPERGELPQIWQDVPALASGYLQEIDMAALARFASGCGRIVALAEEIGAFVTRLAPLFRLSGSDPVDDRRVRELNEMVVIKNYRTTRQDPGAGLRQIVDIALKALSPSINDTATALTCVDYLGAVLAPFAGIADPGELLYHQGHLCLVTRETRLAMLLTKALVPIVQNAAGNPEVLSAVLKVVERVFDQVQGDDRQRALREIVGRVSATAQSTVRSDLDRTRISEEATAILNLHAGPLEGVNSR